MNRFKQKLEFSNFTLTFGDKHVLLDLFKEIVFPSFHEMRFRKGYKNAPEYFFWETKLLVLDGSQTPPIIGITGRVVKLKKVWRDQIFTQNGIMPDHKSLESAPSSMFTLILNTHRLIFCKEVSDAPTIDNFISLCSYCLKNQYNIFIENKITNYLPKETVDHNALLKINERDTVKTIREKRIELHKEYPYPDLRITPLADKIEIIDFINKFKTIKSFSVKLLKTNTEELEGNNFLKQLEKLKIDTNSSTAKLSLSNKDGLNKEKLQEDTNLATALANAEVKFSGKGYSDDDLSGNNNEFRLLKFIDTLPKNINIATKIMFNNFMSMVQSGTITIYENITHQNKLIEIKEEIEHDCENQH